MKNTFFTLMACFLLSFGGMLSAQSNMVDLGIFKKTTDRNQLEVRLRPTQNVVNGAYSGGIFTVRVPDSYGVTLSVAPNSERYGYAFAGPVGQADGYSYYRYQFSGSVNTVTWEKGKEYPLITLQVNGAIPPHAAFELVTNTPWTRDHNGDFYQELNGASVEHVFYKLPIKIRSFTATPLPSRSVQLDWEYESETDLAYSEVEYCVDGLGFGFIGRAPAGNSSDRTQTGYNFLHNTPQANMNYYRIRMVDINGGVEYSPVRAVNFDDLNADFSVFPNPSAGPLTLVSRNLSKYGTGVRYQFIDNAGKVVKSGNVVDDNELFDLSKMPAGVYNLQILTDQEQLEKFQVVIAN